MNNQSAIHALLHKQKQELEGRVQAIQADFTQQRSADSEDRASESENDETLQALKQEAEAELTEVNTALKKLATGHYQECSSCGQTIAADRLAALPHATLCLHCAEGIKNAH